MSLLESSIVHGHIISFLAVTANGRSTSVVYSIAAMLTTLGSNGSVRMTASGVSVAYHTTWRLDDLATAARNP
jgi:hypothetical protein